MRFFTALLLLFIASCTTQTIKSGFINPVSQQTQTPDEGFSLPVTPNTKVIIWMHGTRNSDFREKCAHKGNRVPAPIKALASAETHLYYLCSKATDGGRQGTYIHKRVNELEATLNKLHQAGLKPRQIFVAGHSAGGWTALMAMKRLKSKFNAAIAFSPACCGSRAQEKIYPDLRQKIRVQQVKDMISASQIKALVFAYEDDAYNRPQELQFLEEAYPSGVKMIRYNCNQGHTSVLKGCKANETTAIIKAYIKG